MKITRTVVIPPRPEQTREELDHLLCDLCGARGNSECEGEISWDKEAPNGDVFETTVMLRVGNTYPESGHWDRTVFHICGDCFQAKLAPWLAEQGAKPTHDRDEW